MIRERTVKKGWRNIFWFFDDVEYEEKKRVK